MEIEEKKSVSPLSSDTPDLIQTECVADSGLAHPKIKIDGKQSASYLWDRNRKNKKVSACCWWNTRSNSNWVCYWQWAGTPKKIHGTKKKKKKMLKCSKVAWYTGSWSTLCCWTPYLFLNIQMCQHLCLFTTPQLWDWAPLILLLDNQCTLHQGGDGSWVGIYPVSGLEVRWKENVIWLTSKMQNKIIYKGDP